MGNVSDDDISLTSTVVSEQQSEYDVETIHAEQEFPDGVKYLVQWAGYPVLRCTWEPAEQFSTDQTLAEWEEKKRSIAEGKQLAFDVPRWEEDVWLDREKRYNRKRRRRAKRWKLASSAPAPSTNSTGNSKPAPRASRSDAESHVNLHENVHPSRQGKILSAPKESPVLFGSGQRDSERTRSKKSHSTDPYRIFNLSTKWRYEKAKRNEPPPNMRGLELMRPSEFTPISPANAITLATPYPTKSNSDETTTDLRQVSGGETVIDTSCVSRSSMASPIQFQAGPPPRKYRSQSQGIFDVQPRRMNPDLQNSTGASEKDKIPKFPRRIPRAGNKIPAMYPNRFWNIGEIFVSMYYGPDRKEIGHVRLCGFDSFSRKQYLRSKTHDRVNIWFQHLCTFDDYNTLCLTEKGNMKIGNGWVEGFDDTEPEVYKLAETLEQNSLIAMCYLDNDRRDVLLGYSPNSPEFKFLDTTQSSCAFSFLNLVLRTSLKPVEHLGSLGSHDSAAKSNTTLSPTASEKHSASSSTNPASPIAIRTPPQDLRRGTQVAVRTSKPVEQDLGRGAGDEMNLDTQADQSLAVALSPQNKQADFAAAFEKQFGVTFEMLATFNTAGDVRGKEMFYLWFPEEARVDMKLVEAFLKTRTSLVYSTQVKEDWERFLSTTKFFHPIILFHESFRDYYTIPSFRDLICKTSSYWTVSLTQPLQYVDRPLHFQRLFPNGGVLLITEDFMLRDPNGTLVTLSWFHEWIKTKFPGTWKIMFRPDVLNWLLKQPEPSDKYRKGTWLAMYHWIMKLGAPTTDTEGHFGAYGDDSKSNVISISQIPKYGSRSEDDHPDIPKGTSQEVRNTDHLAEFFAGWGLVNSHRFRRFYILTTIKPPPERWASWHHIEVRVGARDFMNHFKVDHKPHWKNVNRSSQPFTPAHTGSIEATPYTPRTPKAPGDWRRSSAFSQQAPAKPSYPQPYQ